MNCKKCMNCLEIYPNGSILCGCGMELLVPEVIASYYTCSNYEMEEE